MKYACLVVLAILSAPVGAQVYSCTDAQGKKAYQQTPCDSPAGDYVRCVRPDGSTHLRKGSSCPMRNEPLKQKAGMVLDPVTSQQTFMVPGGGNGMIDPVTGQRHELMGPAPTRQVLDTAQPISAQAACAAAKAAKDSALSNFDRTMGSIRAAEAKYSRMCGDR